jgi:hypothetical protein
MKIKTYADPRTLGCPYCSAKAGEGCHINRQTVCTTVLGSHKARVLKAQKLFPATSDDEGRAPMTADPNRKGAPMLSVYSDDYEWVIAESPEDAYVVTHEATGEVSDPKDYEPGERWQKENDDATTSMWCDATGKVCEIGEGVLTKLTNREWITRFGRGYLGGTEQ